MNFLSDGNTTLIDISVLNANEILGISAHIIEPIELSEINYYKPVINGYAATSKSQICVVTTAKISGHFIVEFDILYN